MDPESHKRLPQNSVFPSHSPTPVSVFVRRRKVENTFNYCNYRVSVYVCVCNDTCVSNSIINPRHFFFQRCNHKARSGLVRNRISVTVGVPNRGVRPSPLRPPVSRRPGCHSCRSQDPVEELRSQGKDRGRQVDESFGRLSRTREDTGRRTTEARCTARDLLRSVETPQTKTRRSRRPEQGRSLSPLPNLLRR